MSDLDSFMEMEMAGIGLGPPMPLPLATDPAIAFVPVLPDVASYIEVGPIVDPVSAMDADTMPQPQPVVRHPPGQYYYFCPCIDCRCFYSTRPPTKRMEVIRPPPKYSYLGFVNAMRAAAARREEDRQERHRAERELAAAAAAQGAKADMGAKDPQKKKQKAMKRRRQ